MRLSHVRRWGLAAVTCLAAFGAFGARAGTVDLEWDGVAGATGYKVYYGLASGQYTQVKDVGNRTMTGGNGPAIQCTAGAFTARSNIMSANLGGSNQYGGTCLHAYSISRPGSVPVGAANSAADPLFVNDATGDLHLQSGSPARGAGDPATDLAGIAALDLDGDTRVAPPDMGADQFTP